MLTDVKKDPNLAAIISFLFSGFGQMYVGDFQRGAFIFIGVVICIIFSFC